MPVQRRSSSVLVIGGAAILVAVALVYGAMPVVDRVRVREDAIVLEREKLARLRGLIDAEDRLRVAVETHRAALDAEPRRLLSARTTALASATLQAALQGFADQSRLTVSRLDVAGQPDATSTSIPATLSAVGDVYGITDLLFLIEHAPLRLEVEGLTVRPNPALRGDLLDLIVTVRAPYMVSRETGG